METQRLELLYHFSELWDLWGNFSLLLTTFVERAEHEYFSGFCSVHWCSQWSRQEESWSESQEYDDNEVQEYEQGEQEEQQIEQALGSLEQFALEISLSSDEEEEESTLQENETFCWFHMSLIFRATPCATLGYWMPN